MERSFKAGDKIRFKDNWWDVTSGKEYDLFKVGDTLKFRDDDGDQLNFYDLNSNCRTGIAAGKELMKEEKEMEFKKGELYKSKVSDAVYKCLSCGNRGYLDFEVIGGGAVGAVTDFSIEYATENFELQECGTENTEEIPVFVKATLDEAIAAFKEGNKSDFYMYNAKKGICTPLVKETNILMLTTWTILKKVGE